MEKTTKESKVYNNLYDIAKEREILLSKIRDNNKEINVLWKDLFEKKQSGFNKGITMSNIVKTGIGVFDGLLFAWKIYRKFKK